MGFDFDDLASLDLVSCTFANGFLVLLDSGAVHNRSGSNSDVVVLGEDPSVEVRRNIVTNVHLGHLFVELHLFVGDLDTFLECDCVVVLAGIHGLGNTRVGTICSNNQVHIHGLLFLLSGFRVDLGVPDGVLVVRGLVVFRDIDSRDKTVHGLGTEFDGTITHVLVQNLTTAHANVFIGLESLTNVDLDSGWRDQVHLAHLAVNNCFGKIELTDHAEWDGTTTRLGVIHFALE
mmetsp:Transcript_9257/g.21350  ORF Transcript_9257/g.21350 Transcript_9257/m.21350 type:complete len:233 (-) Transcript_9257:261-959(-)